MHIAMPLAHARCCASLMITPELLEAGRRWKLGSGSHGRTRYSVHRNYSVASEKMMYGDVDKKHDTSEAIHSKTCGGKCNSQSGVRWQRPLTRDKSESASRRGMTPVATEISPKGNWGTVRALLVWDGQGCLLSQLGPSIQSASSLKA